LGPVTCDLIILSVSEYGANIAIGDWNETEGKALAEELKEYVFLPQVRSEKSGSY
jgi:hypothetical protein